MNGKRIVIVGFAVLGAVIFILWVTAICFTLVRYSKAQAAIIALSGAAIFLVIQESPRIKGWGCVLGFLSEPFWIWSSYYAQPRLIGQVIAAPFFIFVWLRGIWLHLVKPKLTG